MVFITELPQNIQKLHELSFHLPYTYLEGGSLVGLATPFVPKLPVEFVKLDPCIQVHWRVVISNFQRSLYLPPEPARPPKSQKLPVESFHPVLISHLAPGILAGLGTPNVPYTPTAATVSVPDT